MTRFAIIGSGTMGQRHAEILAATEGACVAAVCDAHSAAAAELAARHRVRALTFEEILAAEDIDVVVLCTPSSLHAEQGIRAVEAGKDVFAEKPIDTLPERGVRLIEAARARGRCLTVVSQNRFLEGSWALKQALDAGLLGRPLHAHVSVKWHRDDKYYTSSNWRGRWSGEGGGVLMNQGIHYMDLLLWYLGEAVEVEAMVSTTRSVIETEDIGLGLVRFGGGAIAAVEVSTGAYPGFPERLEIHGSKGSCILEQGKIAFWKTSDGAAPPEVQFDPPTPPDLPGKFIPFQRQYADFLRAREQKRPPVVRPEEALNVIRTVLAFYESARSRAAVKVNPL